MAAGQLPVVLNQEYRVKLGRSFTFPKENSFHTIKYDFKPKSVDSTQPGRLKVNGEEVSVSMPVIQAESVDDVAIFKGAKRSCAKECILIINTETGEAVLEKISNTVQLKGVRDLNKKKKFRSISPLPSKSSKPSINTTPLTQTLPTKSSNASSGSLSVGENKKVSNRPTKRKMKAETGKKAPTNTTEKTAPSLTVNKSNSPSPAISQHSSALLSMPTLQSISPIRSNNPTPEPQILPLSKKPKTSLSSDSSLSGSSSSSSSDSDSDSDMDQSNPSILPSNPQPQSMLQFTTAPPVTATTPTFTNVSHMASHVIPRISGQTQTDDNFGGSVAGAENLSDSSSSSSSDSDSSDEEEDGDSSGSDSSSDKKAGRENIQTLLVDSRPQSTQRDLMKDLELSDSDDSD